MALGVFSAWRWAVRDLYFLIPIACIPAEQVHYAIDIQLAKPQIFRAFNKHPI